MEKTAGSQLQRCDYNLQLTEIITVTAEDAELAKLIALIFIH